MIDITDVRAAAEMRRQAIQRMTDDGVWKEQAEYIMDTLFSGGRAPSFADFLDQYADIARVLLAGEGIMSAEMWSGFDPQTLPRDADNYDVWCERCQKVHKHFTYTQEDHARVIAQAVKNLSDEIDRRAAAEAYRSLGFDPR